MNILLLVGGRQGEHEVSLRSGQAVARAFDALGYEYTQADPGDPNFDLDKSLAGVDLVFLALHGRGGEDGGLQAELEKRAIRFTGAGSEASHLCSDKWVYKQLLAKEDIPTPKGDLVTIHDMNSPLFKKPYVLKPCDEGSSLDTHIVRKPNADELADDKRLLENHEEMLLEELIEGTEITVGVLGDEALPIIEIIPPEGREFDYHNKYNGETQELCPPQHVSEELQDQAKLLALRIHRLTGCRVMSRTDIMIDSDGDLFVLETNTLPGMTEQSLYPKMGLTAGYAWPEFIDRICQLSLAD